MIKLNNLSTDLKHVTVEYLDIVNYEIARENICGYASAFVAVVMIFFLALFLFVPSMDEIQQRRSEVNNLKQYSLDISKCEGQTCVKVMKKQCGYGKNGDYCVIDPK